MAFGRIHRAHLGQHYIPITRMAQLRGKIKGKNSERKRGKSRNLGTEIGKREAKKGFKLSDGRFHERMFSAQLFFYRSIRGMFFLWRATRRSPCFGSSFFKGFEQ
jgi:hypothetical protein